MQKDYLLLIGISVLSGIINMTLPFIGGKDGASSTVYLVFLLFGAGISYGLVTGVYFIYALPLTKKYSRLIKWIFASTISYAAGAWATLMSNTSGFFDRGPRAVSYALGGLVGAFVIATAFHFIFHKIGKARFLITIGVGTLLPFILFLLFENINEPPGFPGILYLVWQSVITIALGSSFLSQKSECVNQQI